MTSSNKAQKRDLTTGPIWRHVFRMSAPMVIGIGSIISFAIADTYFIGRLGATQLAAIGYTFPVTTMFFNIVFGMAIAMSAVVSRKIGSGLMEDVKTTVTIGLAMVTISSILLSICGYMLMIPMFNSLGAGAEVMPYIQDYMPIWFLGAVFLSVPVVSNAAIRGMGDPFWPAVIMVMIAVINIILDPILIFGLFGAPRLEVQGAAIASLIAYISAFLVVISLLIFREKVLSPLCMFSRQAWKMASKPLLVIAIPVALANLVTPLMAYGYTMILSDLGNEAVAGFGVVSRFEAFALIPIMALAGGIAPLIGQNYGAGHAHRVDEAISKALKFAVYYGLGCAAVLAFIAEPVAGAFSDNAIIHDFVTKYLWFVPFSFVGLNMFLVVTSSMNAVEKPKTSLVLNLIRAFVIALPTAWYLVNEMGAQGFYIAIIATNILSAVCAIYYIKSIRCNEPAKAVV